jgi:regulator of replication initiation timing
MYDLGGDDARGSGPGGDPLGGDLFEAPEKEEEEEAEDDDKGADAPPKGEEEPGEPGKEPEAPTEIKVGDKTFTPEKLAEIVSKGEDYTKKTQELSQEREEFKTDLDAGKTYLGALKVFDSGAQGAAQVIDQFVNAAKARYGDAFTEHMMSGIDFENLSEEGQKLNTRIRTLSSQAQSLFNENQELKVKLEAADKSLAELKPVLETAKQTEAIDAAVINIKRDLKVEVTSTDLRKMMKDTGEADPVKAYKLATYEEAQKRGYNRGYSAKSKTPDMPDANQGKTFDPTKTTADETLRLLQRGFQPVGVRMSPQQQKPPA